MHITGTPPDTPDPTRIKHTVTSKDFAHKESSAQFIPQSHPTPERNHNSVHVCFEHLFHQENILYQQRSTVVFPIDSCMHVHGETFRHACSPSHPDQHTWVQRS